MIVKSDLAYILLPANDSAATSDFAPAESAATSGLLSANGEPGSTLGKLLADLLQEGGGNTSVSRQVKSVDMMEGSLMPVTEEPYITDLDLESFLIDVTDNALDLVMTTDTTDVGVTDVGVTATSRTGVTATEVGNTVVERVTDWLSNVTMVARGDGEKDVEPRPATVMSDLADVVFGNRTESSGVGLGETVMSEGPSTARGLLDITTDIYDLLTELPSNVNRLANGLELTKEEDFGHTDNVNDLFKDRNLSVEDFTQNAQHVFFTAEPPSGGLKDYTDNVFKMLFHADEMDGLLELAGDRYSNCSVWNVTETAAESGGSGGLYGLDKNFLVGELVLVMGLCIPASLTLIIYILRYWRSLIIKQVLFCTHPTVSKSVSRLYFYKPLIRALVFIHTNLIIGFFIEKYIRSTFFYF